MIIILKNHCNSPPFSITTDYTTKEVKKQDAIPPPPIEAAESLLNYVEIGTLILPEDIQSKIDQKTEAINAVELAKLDRQKQDEINQKIVDEQKAESEKELLKRKNEADAAAYEKEKAAQAQLTVAENNVKIAEQKVTQAQLEREAELEKQGAFTEEYFRDKELDVQKEAVKSINASVKTIVTDGTGSGYGALAGLKEILGAIE